MKKDNSLRLMTYNIGGIKSSNYSFDSVLQIIKELSPDFLCIQEIVEMTSGSGKLDSQVQEIASILGENTSYWFGPTISLYQNFHPSKNLFVDLVFKDTQEWLQGNAFFSKMNFIALGDELEEGLPKNLPLFTPVSYEGNRNTDPRKLLISRINIPQAYPYVLGTHLTTLVGEHDENPEMRTQVKGLAQKMRLEQTKKILQIIERHTIHQGKMTILMGDFNANEDESCIVDILETEGKFVRLIPENIGNPQTVDHIFIFAGDNCIDYRCRIYNEEIAYRASDHFPVYADISISSPTSKGSSKQCPGVFARYNE